jgi:hypothetical protein
LEHLSINSVGFCALVTLLSVIIFSGTVALGEEVVEDSFKPGLQILVY